MITGLSKPIKDFLKQERQYMIPRYQREYVWEEKQWTDLYADLKKNYIKSKTHPDLECHFIGSIVVLEKRRASISSADIIDGQQRMTTFFILMLVIMRIANIRRDQDLFGGMRDYLKARTSIGEQYDKFINEDNPYFKELLNKCTVYTDNIDLIGRNEDIIRKRYAFQEKFINECFTHLFSLLYNDVLSEEIDLKEFTNRIMGTIIIETLSTNVGESYTIFEILNARGKQLENHELIKNYIMRYYEPSDSGDVALKDWNLLMDLLKKNSATARAFFEHYVSHKYDKSQEKKGKQKPTTYDYIIANNEHSSKELMDDIMRKAKLYVMFSKPFNFDGIGNVFKKRIKDSLLFFKGRSQTQFRPLFMSLFSRLFTDKSSPNYLVNLKKLSEIVAYLEKFYFIFGVVLNERSSVIEKIVHSCAYSIENCPEYELDSNIEKLRTQLSSMLPDYSTFENAFCNLGYSNKNARYGDEEGNKEDIKYVLTMYEMYLRNSFDEVSPFSIEHIHKDTGADVYCKIGNLTCLEVEINSSLGSKPASSKMSAYRTSSYFSANKIAEIYDGKWEAANIENRGKELARLLYEEIWNARSATNAA